ncbi:glutathione peroxidase [Sphingomonas montana]|uniref:glutathione peroxidase n=1 Tax=Sphingomonas montana TaxID=1843236 RepID=UPI00096D55FB|nr:redoxin domain-containing protein [Sphingomonas montana]
MPTVLSEIPLKTIDGADATLADYAGQVLLIVNVASRCGLTKQYDALEALYAKYKDQGFAVLGFPSNDFAGQEPGTDAEIAAFCRSAGATFPMFAKIAVTGPDIHPLYRALTDAEPDAQGGTAMRDRLATHGLPPAAPSAILWNFEKFVLGRDGQVVARFTPDTLPDADALVTVVERELFASE